MSGQELVETASQFLPCASQLSAERASPWGGSIPPLYTDMVCDPFRRGPRPGLRGGAGHVRKGGLVDQLRRGCLIPTRCRPVRRCLGVFVGHLVSLYSDIGGDPANGDLIPTGVNAVTDLDGR